MNNSIPGIMARLAHWIGTILIVANSARAGISSGSIIDSVLRCCIKVKQLFSFGPLQVALLNN